MVVSRVAVTTTLSAGAGGLVALSWRYFTNSTWDLVLACNGALAGVCGSGGETGRGGAQGLAWVGVLRATGDVVLVCNGALAGGLKWGVACIGGWMGVLGQAQKLVAPRRTGPLVPPYRYQRFDLPRP